MENVMDTTKPAATIKCWVEMYSDNMFSWAFHKTSSKETAEDLVQETFLAAVQSFENFKGESNPKTWLFSILNNKINDHFRKAYRKPTVKDDLILERIFDHDNADKWRVEEKPQQWTYEAGHLLDDAEFQQALHHCTKNYPATGFLQSS